MTTNTNGDSATCTSFRFEDNFFSVYRDQTAQSTAGWHYKRREDGKWLRTDGSYLDPRLNAALDDAWKRLTGEGGE